MQTEVSATPPPGVVTGVGLNEVLISSLRNQLGSQFVCENLLSERRLTDQVQQGILRADTILLGSGIERPISVAQKVHSFDKTIPVLILTAPDKCDDLRRSIMFAPLLGNVVTPWSTDKIDSIGQEVSTTVARHRQRRFYLDTIDSVQPKIGKLSLSQPEVGHYLGRLLDQAPIGVVSLDADGKILSINRQAGKILGIEEREAHSKSLSEFFDKQTRARFENLLVRSAIGEQFGMKPEILQTARIGTGLRYLEATASRTVYRAGRRGYMVILQDVTTRERAESQRKKIEDHMRNLSSALEQAADSVMITDANRIIEYVNPAFEALTGYSKLESIGNKIYFLRSGVHDQAFYGKLWETISSGNVFRGVLVNKRKDGSIYHEEKTITPIRNSEGKITNYISTGHDITERLKNEETARQRQAESAHAARLSTLGEMTSGIAHELNQPLCAITTYAQTCMRIVSSDNYDESKLNYGLQQVVKQADLASGIFERLRNFARKGGEPKRRVDLLEIVDETVSLISAELNQKQVNLEVIKAVPSARVCADPIQIEQVILNLIRNGIDAIADVVRGEKNLVLTICDTEGGVKSSLQDNGPGCPDEVVDRLFEPFFSTKPTGLGIGLGISESIIEDHGGRLFLESNGNTGATFSFILPRWQQDQKLEVR